MFFFSVFFHIRCNVYNHQLIQYDFLVLCMGVCMVKIIKCFFFKKKVIYIQLIIQNEKKNNNKNLLHRQIIKILVKNIYLLVHCFLCMVSRRKILTIDSILLRWKHIWRAQSSDFTNNFWYFTVCAITDNIVFTC